MGGEEVPPPSARKSDHTPGHLLHFCGKILLEELRRRW